MAYRPPPIIDEVLRKFDAAKGSHDQFVRFHERMERAYRGILEPRSGADKWRHKYAPKYGFNLIEGVVANTIEEGLKIGVRPSPHVNPSLEEAQQMLERAESIEYLLRHEHRIDEMDDKQRPLFLSAAISGSGFGKEYWNWLEGPVRSQGVVEKEVYDDEENFIGTVPTIQEITKQGTIRDHSTMEVCDPRDLIIHESARALQPWEPGGAQHLFHRCWYSFEQLKMMEASGFLSNVDMLKESLDFADEYETREKQLWDSNRQKDLIEVLEYWCFKNGQVYRALVGNRMVVLRPEEAVPFWHGGYPFISFSMMPGILTARGHGTMELIYELQSMLWEIGNQRLDNIELINNAIMLIRSDTRDHESFDFFPGAKWIVEDTAQVEPLIPPYQLAEITMGTEALIKGDIQNVTAASPFASGSDSATVDNKTATGASLVMSAAQKQLAAKKYQAMKGLRREAQMRIKNCQQFISENKLVQILGEDGATSFLSLSALDIQGEYVAELEPMSESINRQEKRAEASQFFQTMLQGMPMLEAGGVPINAKALFKWFARKWDIIDVEQFFAQQPQPAVLDQGAGGGGGAASPAMPAEGANMGITAETAVDASSPSATGGNSLSGEQFMARALSYAP